MSLLDVSRFRSRRVPDKVKRSAIAFHEGQGVGSRGGNAVWRLVLVRSRQGYQTISIAAMEGGKENIKLTMGEEGVTTTSVVSH